MVFDHVMIAKFVRNDRQKGDPDVPSDIKGCCNSLKVNRMK